MQDYLRQKISNAVERLQTQAGQYSGAYRAEIKTILNAIKEGLDQTGAFEALQVNDAQPQQALAEMIDQIDFIMNEPSSFPEDCAEVIMDCGEVIAAQVENGYFETLKEVYIVLDDAEYDPFSDFGTVQTLPAGAAPQMDYFVPKKDKLRGLDLKGQWVAAGDQVNVADYAGNKFRAVLQADPEDNLGNVRVKYVEPPNAGYDTTTSYMTNKSKLEPIEPI